MSQTPAPQIALKREFIVDRDGRDFVLYAGLLDAAHQQGLKRIETRLVQIPDDSNGQVAIVQATVETDRGVFQDLGDASPANVTRMLVPHIIRMASTRAKARALRDAVNVGVAALEEAGPGDAEWTAADWQTALEGATSLDELQQRAKELNEAHLPAAVMQRLKPVYLARKAALTPKANPNGSGKAA